jgi:hypothetical protein
VNRRPREADRVGVDDGQEVAGAGKGEQPSDGGRAVDDAQPVGGRFGRLVVIERQASSARMPHGAASARGQRDGDDQHDSSRQHHPLMRLAYSAIW